MVQLHYEYRENFDRYYNDLISHPLMERLLNIAQLGQIKRTLKRRAALTPLVHAHTRFDHSINSGHNAEILYTRTMGRCPIHWEIIPATLVHDDGQPGYGHAAQGVYMDLEEERTGKSRNHNARGIEANATVKDNYGRTVNDIIELMGGSPKLAEKYLRKWKEGSPEEKQGFGLIRHPFFSPEKAEYLLADAVNTGFWDRPPAWETYCGSITIGDEGPGIDISASPLNVEAILKRMQTFHPQAWGEIYYSRQSFAAQRSFERALELGMRSQNIDIADAWWWVDYTVETFLNSLEKKCPEAFKEFRRYSERRFFERGILFTLTPDESYGDDMDNMLIKPTGEAEQKAISASVNTSLGRTRMEDKAREHFKGLELRVMVTQEPHKFEPQDVRVYNGSKYLGTVLEGDKSHRDHLLHVGKKHYRAEILFPPEAMPTKRKREEVAEWFIEEARKLAKSKAA